MDGASLAGRRPTAKISLLESGVQKIYSHPPTVNGRFSAFDGRWNGRWWVAQQRAIKIEKGAEMVI